MDPDKVLSASNTREVQASDHLVGWDLRVELQETSAEDLAAGRRRYRAIATGLNETVNGDRLHMTALQDFIAAAPLPVHVNHWLAVDYLCATAERFEFDAGTGHLVEYGFFLMSTPYGQQCVKMLDDGAVLSKSIVMVPREMSFRNPNRYSGERDFHRVHPLASDVVTTPNYIGAKGTVTLQGASGEAPETISLQACFQSLVGDAVILAGLCYDESPEVVTMTPEELKAQEAARQAAEDALVAKILAGVETTMTTMLGPIEARVLKIEQSTTVETPANPAATSTATTAATDPVEHTVACGDAATAIKVRTYLQGLEAEKHSAATQDPAVDRKVTVSGKDEPAWVAQSGVDMDSVAQKIEADRNKIGQRIPASARA